MANFVSCVSVLQSFHFNTSLKLLCFFFVLYKIPPGACDQGLLILCGIYGILTGNVKVRASHDILN